MLGLLLLYFIGKKFYELADQFEKHKWLYTILSIVVYYSAGFILTAVAMVLDFMVFEWGFDWEATWGVSYISVPLGLLGAWVYYRVMKNRWEHSVILVQDEIQEIGKLNSGV